MLDLICVVSVPVGGGRLKRAKPEGPSNKNALLDVGKHWMEKDFLYKYWIANRSFERKLCYLI
jgi:hypothetical protein